MLVAVLLVAVSGCGPAESTPANIKPPPPPVQNGISPAVPLTTEAASDSGGWVEYANTDDDSDVTAYRCGPGYIEVRFSDDTEYLYTNESAGLDNVSNMQWLASEGDGLNAYINDYCYYGYVGAGPAPAPATVPRYVPPTPQPCSLCGGQGHDSCTTCEGRGENTCEWCTGVGGSVCSICRGKGRLACSSCGGVGYSSGSQCYRCYGVGSESCYGCGGAGGDQCSACRGSDIETCWACSGSGEKKCLLCGGAGTF
ncbi:MAG: hypothetical protein FD171_1283 [Actinobacteria bacterium]|nr:MAG: hypothetical protein FD171_1283 [Actinomycetota bacterium]